MNIYANEGDKVVFLNKNGYPVEREDALDAGLIEGQVYTVDHTVVHSSSTDVYIKEFPRHRFNSVMFDDLNEVEEVTNTKEFNYGRKSIEQMLVELKLTTNPVTYWSLKQCIIDHLNRKDFT